MSSHTARPDGVLLIAIWAFASAALVLVGVLAIGLFAYPAVIDNTQEGRAAALFGLSVGTALLVLSLGVSIGAGVGLVRGREWGRVLGIVFAALNLLWFPIGTALGVMSIVYLAKEEVRGYFGAGSQEARGAPRAA